LDKEEFRDDLLKYFDEFKEVIATEDDKWIVKGFIDVYKNIYTISIDTKVISKIIELMLFPVIQSLHLNIIIKYFRVNIKIIIPI